MTPADGKPPEPLHVYAQELKRLGRDGFRDAYGDAFLLIDAGLVRARADLAATTLEPRPPDGADDEITAPTSFEVFPVRSASGAAQVKVGRAAECDIVISDQSVSSVHALFERSSTGALSLQDNRSKNGTFVDENFLGGRAEAFPLGGRHSLRFGSLSAVFLDVDALAEMARMLVPDVP